MVFPESAEMRDRVCREAKFYKLSKQMMESYKVEFNVGGIHYTTTRGTLLSSCHGETSQYIKDLLSSEDGKGRRRIMIDTDGEAFRYILDYLRNGSRMVFPESVEMRDCVCREAHFYGLSAFEDIMMKLVYNIKLRIMGWKRMGYNEQVQQYGYNLSLNLARFKMYPGNWFEQKFSTNDVDLPITEKGIYMLDRKENFTASAIVAEYVGGSDCKVIKNLPLDKFDAQGIYDAVAFFGFPRALGYEIITHWKKIKNIPE